MSIFWRVLMLKLKDGGHELLCLTPPGDAASEKALQSYGARIINYPLKRKGLNPFQDIGSFLALKKIFLREKPDLLFASTIKPVIYGLLAAKRAKVPATFATITGLGYVFERNNPFKRLISLIGSRLYRLALKGANGIFFQNNDDRELFLNNAIIENEMPVRMARGTGVDTNKFSPAPLPELRPGALNFLFIGRLLEAKGLFEYAKAAKVLASRWPQAIFQILGPMEKGPGAISSSQLREWQEHSNIQYLGSSDDVRPFIAKAHAIVLPSWREGTSTSIMEAMSMERACIVSDVPGCRELVCEGRNGFLCKAHDAQDLARVMEKFLTNPDLLQPMARESRKMAVSIYDANKVAENIINDMKALSLPELWQPKEVRHD